MPDDSHFTYRDPVIDTELRATTYPYGAGRPGVGIQITLDQQDATIMAVRLPQEQAWALGDWIAAAMAQTDRAEPITRPADITGAAPADPAGTPGHPEPSTATTDAPGWTDLIDWQHDPQLGEPYTGPLTGQTPPGGTTTPPTSGE
jgi:hypothetical protein